MLLAAALAAPAAGQTVKTLGYNTTNGNVVYGGTNPLTFTNPLQFATNARAATRTNLGGTAVGDSLFTAASAGDAATAILLGTTNIAVFKGVTVSGANISGTALLENGGFAVSDDDTNNANSVFQFLGTASERLRANARLDLGLGLPALTNTSNSSFRTAIGLGATNSVTFSNVTTTGTLTVKSLATTDPVSWALDAVQIAADTNGVIALPDTANILRVTNANTISAVSNGRLGAFYFLLNQSGTNVVISNSATITARGATNITLGANESATLISTTATNATAH
jgi:hypothetical protein